jgi:nucleoid DNA-binding protein
MTKRDIAKQIAERLGVRSTRASEVVQQVFDGIVDTLVNEGRIELRNFGVFEVRKRKSRQARNPRTGEIVDVPERFVVTFKPGRAIQQRVAQFVPRPSHALMPVADRTALR